MIISADVMGGDFAPKEMVLGACEAIKNCPQITKIVLVGDENQITPFIDATIKDRIEIVHTNEIIEMDEHPANAYRAKKNASICIASRLVKEGKADAVVSAGSTGAQLVAGLFEIGRIKGIKRPAIAVALPSLTTPKILIDSGANTDIDIINYEQFALMGQSFAKILLNKRDTSVALLCNGTEETKGTELVQKAHQALRDNPKINFLGNVEGNGVMTMDADVIVCDGFAGNILLKSMEGVGKTLFKLLKEGFSKSLRYKIGALLLKPCLKEIAGKFDAKEVGGSPLLGLKGISIVCHGNSDATAFSNGIKMAVQCIENNLVEEITKSILEE